MQIGPTKDAARQSIYRLLYEKHGRRAHSRRDKWLDEIRGLPISKSNSPVGENSIRRTNCAVKDEKSQRLCVDYIKRKKFYKLEPVRRIISLKCKSVIQTVQRT